MYITYKHIAGAIVYQSKPQWIILNGQTVGGLSPLCMHLPHDIILQAGIINLSFKSTKIDIGWSDSKRVDCVLSYNMHQQMMYCRLAYLNLSFTTAVGFI